MQRETERQRGRQREYGRRTDGKRRRVRIGTENKRREVCQIQGDIRVDTGRGRRLGRRKDEEMDRKQKERDTRSSLRKR